MKIIGLVGGISWTSTVDYYRRINEGVNARLGGLDFAHCLIDSLNFGDVQRATWPQAGPLLVASGQRLAAAGAQGLALCANTAHLFAAQVAHEVPLPLIDITEETAAAVRRAGLTKVALLGTKFTMEMPFYRERLAAHGVEMLVPDTTAVRDYVQQTVRDELGVGLVRQETRSRYLDIIDTLVARGAQGLVLGCTEIPLMLGQADFDMPVFDTVAIHADAIVDFMLAA